MWKNIFLVGGLLVLSLVIFQYFSAEESNAALDEFAQCLSEKGAIMYGADWCPHCQNEKKAFGSSFKFVNYVECADPSDPYKQAKACADADIQGYPTWVRADNERVSGSKTLEFLAEWADCQ